VDVGSLVIPEIFGLAFNTRGTVVRVCVGVWRNGPTIGARFITAKELREDHSLHKIKANTRPVTAEPTTTSR
jgi:hypothetical protein